MKKTHDVIISNDKYSLQGEVDESGVFKLIDVKYRGVFITGMLKELSHIIEPRSIIVLVAGNTFRFQVYEDGKWQERATHIHEINDDTMSPWEFFESLAQDIQEHDE